MGEAEGGLSVLRTFRLLRVLKLVRFLPALRRQLVVLVKTMDNVATFCMLLMLFIFIFRYLSSFLSRPYCRLSLTNQIVLFSASIIPFRKLQSLFLTFFLHCCKTYYHMHHHPFHSHNYSRRQYYISIINYYVMKVMYFLIILCLFVCCSILGMHLFGCKFGLRQDTGDTLPDRKNFDSLLWATVTVFQVRQRHRHALFPSDTDTPEEFINTFTKIFNFEEIPY